jgi:ubiquinone/menaquinone biosynthesis C-methylase UbiE
VTISTEPAAGGERPYMIRGGPRGRERLRVLARAMRPTTHSLLDRLELAEGASCVDIGCGGGDVALELAARVGETGRVVGVDFDEEKFALAREEATAAGRAVEYRRCDVTTEDPGTGFDLVYVRFLLTHLHDPAAACDRLRRCGRPGGAVAVEDIDVRGSVCEPDSPAYRRYIEIYAATARARGGDPCIGPRLPALLRAAGFEQVRVYSAQPIGASPEGPEGDAKLVSPLTLESIADAAIAAGVADAEELDRVTDELHRLAGDPDTVMSIPRIVQVAARRPL